MMVEGETRRFWIPESLAYQGQPGQPAGMLVFDIQLIRIGARGSRQGLHLACHAAVGANITVNRSSSENGRTADGSNRSPRHIVGARVNLQDISLAIDVRHVLDWEQIPRVAQPSGSFDDEVAHASCGRFDQARLQQRLAFDRLDCRVEGRRACLPAT